MILKLFKKTKPANDLDVEKAIRTVRRELLTDMFISVEASDAVETLIKFAERKIYGHETDPKDNSIAMKDMLLKSLSEEPYTTLSVAYLYAKHYVRYGDDITKAWDTATKQTDALKKAYLKGYADAMECKKGVRDEDQTT